MFVNRIPQLTSDRLLMLMKALDRRISDIIGIEADEGKATVVVQVPIGDIGNDQDASSNTWILFDDHAENETGDMPDAACQKKYRDALWMLTANAA